MYLTFNKLNNDDYLNIYSFMEPIWKKTYDFLPNGQVDYLLDKYFSIDNLLNYVKQGLIYEGVYLANELIGIVGYYINKDHLFLDKIYLKIEFQNKKLSTDIFAYLSKFNLPIRLCVNKNNALALGSYFKHGFKVLEEQVNVLEHGFINYDYILEN